MKYLISAIAGVMLINGCVHIQNDVVESLNHAKNSLCKSRPIAVVVIIEDDPISIYDAPSDLKFNDSIKLQSKNLSQQKNNYELWGLLAPLTRELKRNNLHHNIFEYAVSSVANHDCLIIDKGLIITDISKSDKEIDRISSAHYSAQYYDVLVARMLTTLSSDGVYLRTVMHLDYYQLDIWPRRLQFYTEFVSKFDDKKNITERIESLAANRADFVVQHRTRAIDGMLELIKHGINVKGDDKVIDPETGHEGEILYSYNGHIIARINNKLISRASSDWIRRQ